MDLKMSTGLICKKCKSTDVNEYTELTQINYKNSKIEFPLEYSVCQNCNREFVSTEQIKRSDKCIRQAKAEFDKSNS